MDRDTLSIAIGGIEVELKVLKHALADLRSSSKPPLEKPVHFADLCGIWKGKVDLSFEEIAAAKYRPKPFPTD